MDGFLYGFLTWFNAFFGNMLGGMIVMDLLKSVLGGYASGIPAVAGLYFNLFHPLIQTYIFIILSLTFINEAIE